MMPSPGRFQPLAFSVLLGAALAIAGCGWHSGAGLMSGHHAPPVTLPNPLLVPAVEQEFLWSQVVDAIDDHFRIQREERIRQVGDVITEGRIDTFPTDGSTVLEPWRKDSTHGFEKWHATLQTVRRSAVVRVTPANGGYLIEVSVLKEMEDLYQPENSTTGRKTIAYEDLEGAERKFNPDGTVTLGWMPLGRDVSLEQRILARIQDRLAK